MYLTFITGPLRDFNDVCFLAFAFTFAEFPFSSSPNIIMVVVVVVVVVVWWYLTL